MATEFRFDTVAHAYYLAGVRVPSITQLIEKAGLVSKDYYTEAARQRGTAVHDLTAAYDLQGMTVEEVAWDHPYRGWLLAHAAATTVLRPLWRHIEEPFVHGRLRFGGRPDRVGKVYGQHAIVELKSGAPETCHQIQTALQAVLVADESGVDLPAEHWRRFVLYLKRNGRFKLEQHDRRADFDEARRVLRTCG